MTIKEIRILVDDFANKRQYIMTISLNDLIDAVKKDAIWLYIKGCINAIDAQQ